MLSRVADSLYWMSRYLERAEHTVRLIDVNLNLMLEHSPVSAEERWRRVMANLGAPPSASADRDPDLLLHTLTIDASSRLSIVSCIMAARENARQVREQISSEMWEQLNRLFHAVRASSHDDVREAQPLEFLSAVREGTHLFQGITDSTMLHGEGWQFIQVGRLIERATCLSTLLDAHCAAVPLDTGDPFEWLGLLKSCTAFEAYCKVYTADLTPRRIAEFLLLNPEFPHTVAFCADRLHNALTAIAETTGRDRGNRVDRLAGRLRATLEYAHIDEIMAGGLHQFLADVQRRCAQIHSAVHEVYISYPAEVALSA